MASSHTYQIPSSKSDKLGLVPKSVEVALNPEDLEEGMDAETLKRKFEEGLKQKQKRGVAHEDLSDMVNEHQDKRQRASGSSSRKREFKF